MTEHERRYHADGSRLRAPERIALMEVPRVVRLAMLDIGAATALDVGTGTGVWAEAFAVAGLRVTGVDPNPSLLAAARELLPGASFVEGSAESLPFPDGSFDLLFLGHVLHETDDRLRALMEARRVATKRVAILEWPFGEEEIGPPRDHRIESDAVLKLARQAGFGAVSHERLTRMDYYSLTP
jgi:ubiquinone/menaquinone biosynthesis C-methylase UbiE